MPIQTSEFMAIVKEDTKDGFATIEQRNRFKVGDKLEVLSPNDAFNKIIIVEKMLDKDGEEVSDASIVQQLLKLKTDLQLKQGDILRKNI